MYKKQLRELSQLDIKTIFIDDCSDTPIQTKRKYKYYRITDDMGNNGLGAKNLGFLLADTKWVLSTDLDHTFPPETIEDLALKLMHKELDEKKCYTFKRRKHGKEIQPHCNTIFLTKELFIKAGGYDLRHQGTRSGDHSLLNKLDKEELDLYVDTYGTDDYKDANTVGMNRGEKQGMRYQNERPIINFKFKCLS